MSKHGWAKIHRQFTDGDLWLSEPFTKGQAWVDLFANANHKAGSFWIRGNEIKLKRGQLGWSEVTMAERWTWSRNKVRRFLNWLETEQQIEQQKLHKLTSITTILNYESYQDDTTDDTTERQQKDNRRYTNKNDKNVKNDKKDIYSANFEKIWERYPSKVGKKQSIRHYKASVKNKEDAEMVEKALNNYLTSKRVNNGYIQNGSTWFNNWQDWVDLKDGFIADDGTECKSEESMNKLNKYLAEEKMQEERK